MPSTLARLRTLADELEVEERAAHAHYTKGARERLRLIGDLRRQVAAITPATKAETAAAYTATAP